VRGGASADFGEAQGAAEVAEGRQRRMAIEHGFKEGGKVRVFATRAVVRDFSAVARQPRAGDVVWRRPGVFL